jgi:hypothetical protein
LKKKEIKSERFKIKILIKPKEKFKRKPRRKFRNKESNLNNKSSMLLGKPKLPKQKYKKPRDARDSKLRKKKDNWSSNFKPKKTKSSSWKITRRKKFKK